MLHSTYITSDGTFKIERYAPRKVRLSVLTDVGYLEVSPNPFQETLKSGVKANSQSVSSAGIQTVTFIKPRKDSKYVPFVWCINQDGYITNCVVLPSTITNTSFQTDCSEAGTLYWSIIEKE